jgi:photosystem II stability/assembly factor-like uncharacterized protein
MRKVLTVLFTLILTPALFWAQVDNWIVKKVGNSDFYPISVHAFNMDTVVIAGKDGIIFQTTDGTIPDVPVLEGDGSSIKYMDFIGGTGFACAEDAKIYKTTDYGASWTALDIPDSVYTKDFLSISMASDTVVYAVGKDSAYVKTTDGGLTWVRSTFDFIPGDKDESLDCGVAFADEDHGVIAIDNSKKPYTWYTEDGGESWTLVELEFPTGTASSMLKDIAYAGNNTYVIVGVHYTVFISTDGGHSYTVSGNYTTEYEYNYEICAVDENTIFVGGTNGRMIKTTNGGTTWTEASIPSGASVQDLSFIDANNGFYFGGYGQWYTTTDGGATWNNLSEWPSMGILGITSTPSGKLFATFWYGELASSVDGNNWSYPSNALTGETEKTYAIAFVDDDNGLVGARDGNLYKTTDGGASWTKITENNTMYDDMKSIFSIEYLNSDTVVAVGKKGAAMISIDGGTNWTKIKNADTKDLNDLSFLSSTQLLIAADGGKIYKASAALDSIWEVNDYGSMDMMGMEFRGNNGVVVAEDGNIYHIDPANWDTLVNVYTSPAGKDYRGVTFATDLTVFAVGYSGTISKSTDGGLTWTDEPNTPTDDVLWAVTSTDDAVWAVGNDATILKLPITTQGVLINEFMSHNDATIADSSGDYADWIEIYNANSFEVNLAGKYLITDDANAPFSEWHVFVHESANSDSFTTIPPDSFALFWANKKTQYGADHLPFKLGDDEYIGLAQIVGSDTVIIDTIAYSVIPDDQSFGRKTDGGDEWVVFEVSSPRLSNLEGTISAIEYDGTVVPKAYELKQNYPNPFNPVTTIEFNLAKAGDVKLEIFNSLGQRVGTLINEKMNAGKVSLVWDASKLASGIYFYRLSAGSYHAVKKMVLIK